MGRRGSHRRPRQPGPPRSGGGAGGCAVDCCPSSSGAPAARAQAACQRSSGLQLEAVEASRAASQTHSRRCFEGSGGCAQRESRPTPQSLSCRGGRLGPRAAAWAVGRRWAPGGAVRRGAVRVGRRGGTVTQRRGGAVQGGSSKQGQLSHRHDRWCAFQPPAAATGCCRMLWYMPAALARGQAARRGLVPSGCARRCSVHRSAEAACSAGRRRPGGRSRAHSFLAASAVCSTRAAASGAASPARDASRAVPQVAVTAGSIQPPWFCQGLGSGVVGGEAEGKAGTGCSAVSG